MSRSHRSQTADAAARAARAADILAILHDRGQTLATAESLTGGLLAARVTDVAGASAVFRGGVVAYATDLKESVLGVPAAVVERHGVVSGECARAMAQGVRRVSGATYALSTTGVAGPDRQEDKPVGTVYVALEGPDGHGAVIGLELVGDRAAIRERTCWEALELLAGHLRGDVPGEAAGDW